jgi:hypothetical protein
MSLLKLKKSDRATGSLVPPWHPNFRNFERLPDVKVVRTSFFVNSTAIVIALTVLSYFVWQEYNLHEVRAEIDDLQHQIDANQKASEQAVQLYQKFQGEEKKATEIEAFMKTDFVFSDFTIELAQTLPKNIGFNFIDMHESGVTLRGIVEGTSDEAFGSASAYIDQLRADPHIGPRFESIAFPQNGLSRAGAQNGHEGGLSFELFIKAKKAPKS